MKFNWDKDKNKRNIEKHGINFSDAYEVFSDTHLIFEDTRYDYGECRYCAFGHLRGRMVVMVYTLRKDVVRMISMRKANEREQKAYKDRFKST